jgi:hypothetical protein
MSQEQREAVDELLRTRPLDISDDASSPVADDPVFS